MTINRPTRPMSPCISICTLDEDKVCMGCKRTLDEIRGWAKLDGEEQWTLIAELEQRQASRRDNKAGL
jgi:predicted Fe-S protein YdhL (DUF1289 family)